jgi:hypothetical protein
MKFSKKNLENLKRHRFNVTRLNIRNEQLAKETEEKEFKKYISFYWIKRSQEKAKHRRKREKNNRLKEKEERIEEIKKINAQKVKELLSKIKKREEIKEEYDKDKKEKLRLDKEAREEKMRRCKTNRDEMIKEQYERRLDILEYQYDLLRRNNRKNNMDEMKRVNVGEKTVINQLVLEQSLRDFYKKMDRLKSQSIYKKTPEQRYKIYKDLKKVEAEKRKKELEEKIDKMLNKQ